MITRRYTHSALLPYVSGAGSGEMTGQPIPNKSQLAAYFKKDTSGVMKDSIGLSTADYLSIDASVRDIFFIDASTVRPAAGAYALAMESPFLNTGTMVGNSNILALYQHDTDDTVLVRALKYVKFITEPLMLDFDPLYLDNSALYIGAPNA